MFLYWFVQCQRRLQTLVYATTSKQLFRFLSFLAGLMDLTYILHSWFWSISVMTLTLNFQGHIWNLLYLSQKWSDCHEKRADISIEHQVWPWLWPWLNVFKVKYAICYISAKNGAIATKWKANISLELKASMTIEFDLIHDLERWSITNDESVNLYMPPRLNELISRSLLRRNTIHPTDVEWQIHTIVTLLYVTSLLTHCGLVTPYAVFALRFENLLARNWSLKIFKHDKEEKLAGPKGNLAGPAPFLVAEGLGPALNAKTAYGVGGLGQHWFR